MRLFIFLFKNIFMKIKSILLILISLLIFGCNSKKEPNYQCISKKVDSIAENSSNAIDVSRFTLFLN